MEARVITPNWILRVGHSMQLIKRFPVNRNGRDFIVSDLHGCLNLLQELLAHVDFDSNKDRLFSTGDLADRGPDSPGCLNLLNEPWFRATIGNHDDILIDYLLTLDDESLSAEHLAIRANLIHNGGDWVISDLAPLIAEMPTLVKQLCSLPLIISVGGADDDRFHVAHGDLLFNGYTPPTDLDLDSLEEEPKDPDIKVDALAGLSAVDAYNHVIWSRRLISGHRGIPLDVNHEGLSPVYVGHTIRESVERRASHLFIDGGAYVSEKHPSQGSRYGLNLIDHTNRSVHRSNGQEILTHSLEELITGAPLAKTMM